MNKVRYTSLQRYLAFMVAFLIVLTSVYPLTATANSGDGGNSERPDVLTYGDQRAVHYKR